jgi:hypothetical protein
MDLPKANYQNTLDVERFVWRPPGPVAKAFIESRAPVKGIMGPFGSGKSASAVLSIIYQATQQPELLDGTKRMRVAIIRNTMDQLKTTIWKTWLEIVGEEVGEIHTTAPMSHNLRVKSLSPGCEWVELEVWFLSMDNPSSVRKLKGIELTMAHLEEATELDESILHVATARVQRYPKARDENPDNRMHRCVMMTTNPCSEAHWYHRLSIKDVPAEWQFFFQPSGLSPNAENIKNLSPNYYQDIAKGKSKEWIRIFVDGQFGYLNTNRVVYPTFSIAMHKAAWDKETLAEFHYPLHLGVDFGLTPAVTFGYQLPMGRWKIDREIVTENCGALRLGQEIIRVLKSEYKWYWETSNYRVSCDPAGEGRAQTDENSPLLVLQALGLKAQSAPTNNPVTRKEAVESMLSRITEGEPAIQIHESCTGLLEGFSGGYHYRKLDIAGDAQYTNEPVKNMSSHVHDALQYLMLGAGEGAAMAMAGRRYENGVDGRGAKMKVAPRKSVW